MTATAEQVLERAIARCAHNPLRFVEIAFPWGEGDLIGQAGPREWQADVLREIGERLRAGKSMKDAMQPVRLAVASGHGIGKSALVCMVILWALSTFADTKAVITANTAGQLATKLWPELAKWHRLAINSHWFVYTATSLYSADPKHEKTWRADAIPWSANHTEAFAGLHNKGKRILLVFDEGSGIDDPVWEVAEGALTDADTEIIWLVPGNPTRNRGRFRECFGRFAHRWWHRQIDSRTVPGTNRDLIEKWRQDYGEDSDFFRVRVLGQFPKVGSMQFISSAVVADAASKPPPPTSIDDPVVMGADIARFGDDETVLKVRVGRDARGLPAIAIRGADTMQVAGRIASEIERLRPLGIVVDMVFVDETGVGAGVVDRLRQLGIDVQGVNNGAKPDMPSVNGELVANKGAECWTNMREALRTGLAIEDDPDLRSQLETREYGYNAHNAIVLERKDDMKKRGLASPDRADALALTYAYPVVKRQARRAGVQRVVSDFDPYRSDA